MVEDKLKKAALAGVVVGLVGAGLYVASKIAPAVALPEIRLNTISAPKTTLAVGEAVNVSGELTFASPLPSDASASIDVYSNDVKVFTFKASCPKGSSKATYSFTISFPSPGTYNVYTDAKW
jgi:hypothetical protein